MRPRSAALRRLSNAKVASTIAAVGAPAGSGENRPARTLPSVVMPLNGSAASFAQVPNNSCFGVCPRCGTGNPRLAGLWNKRPEVLTAHARVPFDTSRKRPAPCAGRQVAVALELSAQARIEGARRAGGHRTRIAQPEERDGVDLEERAARVVALVEHVAQRAEQLDLL